MLVSYTIENLYDIMKIIYKYDKVKIDCTDHVRKSFLNKEYCICISGELFKLERKHIDPNNIKVKIYLQDGTKIKLINYGLIFFKQNLYKKSYTGLFIITERWRHKQQLLFEQYINSINGNNYIYVIIHQNNNYLFNKGSLINIAFNIMKTLNNSFDYIILHDIDIINELDKPFDYSYTPNIIQISGKIKNYKKIGEYVDTFKKKILRPYCGGIIIINKHVFEYVNGFCNKFDGWGLEDVNFINRIDSKAIVKNIRFGTFISSINPRAINNPNYEYNKSISDNIDCEDGLSNIEYEILHIEHKENKGNKGNKDIYNIYVDFKQRNTNINNFITEKLDLLNSKQYLLAKFNTSSKYVNIFKNIYNIIFHKEIILCNDFICDIYMYDKHYTHITKSIYSCLNICIHESNELNESNESNESNAYPIPDIHLHVSSDILKDDINVYIKQFYDKLFFLNR